MIVKIYAIYDSKVEAYMQPFFMTKNGEAIRAFSDLVNDSNSKINKHPGDYTLFQIGEYDDQSGDVVPNGAKINLGCAVEFKRTPELMA